MSASQNSALASLTETYTDSEEEHEDHHNSRTEEQMEDSDSNSSSRDSSKFTMPAVQQELARTEQKKSLRLVSYNDNEDNPISDDEDKDEESKGEAGSKTKTNDDILEILMDPNDKFAKYRLKYGFTLPPEAKGQPRAELQEKISSMIDKMKVNNKLDMNKIIQERKEFRNPSIYEKLIQFCDINELGTNFPADIYDVSYYGKDSYFEELARVQKVEMDKLEKAKKESAKNEAIAKANKLVEDEPKKRKSKWDQPGFAINQSSGSIANVTNITKTSKTTIINAFGSLSKKPKL